jgi:hypothetical protein
MLRAVEGRADVVQSGDVLDTPPAVVAIEERPATDSADATAAPTAAAAPERSWSVAAGFVLLAAALVLSLWAYWPALSSRWDSDDFLFLRSSILTADGGLLDAAFRDVDGVGGGFRPLALLLFAGLYHLVGDEPSIFHGVLLAAHLASVAMVFVLVRRMFGVVLVAGVAALLVATHPVGFQSVTWVAAINTWGFPLALASWWLLLGAADRAPRSGRYVAAIVVFVAAMLFRETAGLVAVAMLAWAWAERGLRRAVALTAPFFALAALAVVAGKWFTRDSPTYGTIASSWRRHVWTQLQRAWIPSEPVGLVGDLQAALAIVLLLVPLAALYFGHRRVAALAAGFLAAVTGASLVWAGDHPRYFYAAAAFLAITVGGVLAVLLTRAGSRGRAVGWIAVVGAIVLSSWWAGRTRDEVEVWAASSPAIFTEFVDQARRELGALPADTHVFVANVPVELALFGGFYVDAVADVLWPESDVTTEIVAVERVPELRARLASDERLLVFRPDHYGCSVLADGEASAMPIHVVEVRAPVGERFDVAVAQIGPMRDGFGTISWETDGRDRARWRLDLPWLPLARTPWATVGDDVSTRLALVPSADGLAYDAYVDGEFAFHFATFERLRSGRVRTFRVEIGPFGDVPAGLRFEELGPGPCAPAD